MNSDPCFSLNIIKHTSTSSRQYGNHLNYFHFCSPMQHAIAIVVVTGIIFCFSDFSYYVTMHVRDLVLVSVVLMTSRCILSFMALTGQIYTPLEYKWRVWFQNAVYPFLCIREKCSQSLEFTGKCIRIGFGIYSILEPNSSNNLNRMFWNRPTGILNLN
jgi:hypothetical protein